MGPCFGLKSPIQGSGSGYSGLWAAQVCMYGLVRIRTNAGRAASLSAQKCSWFSLKEGSLR